MKKQIKTVAVAASVLAMAGAAHATVTNPIEINIYGASAQYLYWNDAASKFLGANGCKNVVSAQDSTGKHGITEANTCTSFSNRDVVIRYSSKASYESVRSLKGATNPDSCPDAHQRKMADSQANPNNLQCKTITLGASDVAGASFVQESHGLKFGPLGGVQVDTVLTGEDASGLTSYNPLVVPFGFFVNKAVKATKCASSAAANAGEFCKTDADCGNTTGACQNMTIDNITRLQAVNIFSGSTVNWKDFGDYYADLATVACFRHAGSGTHATLDFAIVRGNGWGGGLPAYESAGSIWFNDGTNDLLKCVNGDTTATPNGSDIGAIGYADADQAVALATPTTGLNDRLAAVKYNGVTPSRVAVRNGIYDYWSTQWVYEDKARTSTFQRPIVDALLAYASNPANVPAAKAKYWATKDEMKFMKNSDQEYIANQGAAINPQLP